MAAMTVEPSANAMPSAAVPPTRSDAQFRQEHRCNADHPDHGAHRNTGLHRCTKGEPRANRHNEHEGRKGHSHKTRGDIALGQIDAHIVEPEEGRPLQRQPSVGSRLKPEALPTRTAPDKEDGGSQREAVDDRDFGLDNTELECYREPGRAPDECGDCEKRGGAIHLLFR